MKKAILFWVAFFFADRPSAPPVPACNLAQELFQEAW